MAKAISIEGLTSDRQDVCDLNNRGLLEGYWIPTRLRWTGIAELPCARCATQIRLRTLVRHQRVVISWVFGIAPAKFIPY